MRGVKRASPLSRLPYFDLTKHCMQDMMHLLSGVSGRKIVGAVIRPEELNKAIKKLKEEYGRQAKRRKKSAEDDGKREEARITKLAAAKAALAVLNNKWPGKKLQEKAAKQARIRQLESEKAPVDGDAVAENDLVLGADIDVVCFP